VVAYLEEVRGKLDALDNSEVRRAELERLRAERAREYEASAAGLTRLRTDAARRLEKKVESELGALAMERSVFRVHLAPRDWSESGVDAVEFQISPNVGEEPKPLDRIASGGELSRVALALKTAASGRARKSSTARTLVFDEVDAGIGGRAAETVGRRLKLLAGSSQVLCVTHLPQIAGFADHHFVVEKRESRGRTTATIEELEGAARTREIGRMLSGERVTPEALRHAEQLIRASVGE
jgi:DNA repair protein RecN (Recombination protein N)